MLAHDSSHSVPGITLPPGDANPPSFFIARVGLTDVVKKNTVIVALVEFLYQACLLFQNEMLT